MVGDLARRTQDGQRILKRHAARHSPSTPFFKPMVMRTSVEAVWGRWMDLGASWERFWSDLEIQSGPGAHFGELLERISTS